MSLHTPHYKLFLFRMQQGSTSHQNDQNVACHKTLHGKPPICGISQWIHFQVSESNPIAHSRPSSHIRTIRDNSRSGLSMMFAFQQESNFF